MNNKIRDHVEYLFQGAPRTPRAVELKEELIANLLDRYADMIQQGEEEDKAYSVVIAGIGNVDELIRSLREQEVWNPVNIQMQRQKSAMFISIAVGMYIISFIFPIIFASFGGRMGTIIGAVLMFLMWGGATALLVYNAMSKPKYVKIEETIVEDFKEWNHGKNKETTLYKSLQSIVWLLIVPLYLILGIFFDAWHPGWLVFVLAPVINMIIRLVFLYKGED